MASSFSIQLKNSSHIENVKNAAKDGYTRAKGDNSFSKSARTKKTRAMTVSTMPTTPQRIQAGKNDPNTLREGAREQPDETSMTPAHIAMIASRNLTGSRYRFISITEFSHKANRRSGRPELPLWLVVEFAR